jgi:2'-5' RNA ligase
VEGGRDQGARDERVRLFVALELPEDARRALVRWRAEALGDAPGVRLLSPEHLHATLCFLGWRQLGDIEEIWRACGALAAHQAAELRLGEAVWLPSRRPRVLAVELLDPEEGLLRAQSALSDALEARGWYRPEKRPFFAHVTVARVARGGRPRPRDLPPPPPLDLRGSQLTLYRSRLAPSGAQYEPLHTIELEQGGRGPRSPSPDHS